MLLFGANSSSLIIMTTYPPWGSISMTFMIIGSYSLIVGLDSAAFYLATDFSLRRIVTKSPLREYDFFKSLGSTEMERIVTSKVNAISKQVYDEIQNDNLFALSSEPNNVREYINEVLMEMWGGVRR